MGETTRRGGSAGGLRVLIPALALCLFAPALRAELVVLDDGRFFKVSAYEIRGDSARLTLREGGRITLPLDRVAHVVDDEWVPPDPPSATAFAATGRTWRFSDDLPVPHVPYGRQIYDAAKRHGLDPELVAAVVRAESAFDVRAVSSKGARGLMQLMPATARRFGLRGDDVFDAAANVEAGAGYLGWLLDRFDGDLSLALAAYNAGEGTVDRYRGVPPFRETRSYIRRIFTALGLSSDSVAAL
jgi:hypothetical protein